jgi:hypothetical protein
MEMLILCSLISRFFLNLRAVAHDNPLLLPRGTTGFALDTTSPQMLMAKIMRRNPANLNSNLNAASSSAYIGESHRLGETDMIELSRNHISIVNIDPEAGREREESSDGEHGHGP